MKILLTPVTLIDSDLGTVTVQVTKFAISQVEPTIDQTIIQTQNPCNKLGYAQDNSDVGSSY
jgi:hypothetical protein